MKTIFTHWRGLLRQVRLFPFAVLLTALPLSAQVPSLINYQGRLTDAQGNPVTGNRTMAVRVYDAPTGGNMTYEETVGTVAVANGTYGFRFGSGGQTSVSANETIATTNGTNQVFSGALLGTPVGSVSLTDGVYSWSTTGGSSNSGAFGVSYNGTARSFQIIYYSQVPVAGRSIVASYQTSEEVQTIEAALAGGEAHLALSVNGTEESTRTRLLTVPYALKSKESEDAQALASQLSSLEGNLTTIQSQSATLSSNFTSLNATVAGLDAKVDEIVTIPTTVVNLPDEMVETTQTDSNGLIITRTTTVISGRVGVVTQPDFPEKVSQLLSR